MIPQRSRVDAAGAAVLLLLSGAAYMLGVEPVRAARAHEQERANEVQAENQRAASLDTEARQARAELDALGRQLDAQAVRLRPLSEANRLLAEIIELAEESGLSIITRETRPVTNVGGHTCIPILLAGDGGYSSLTSFLARLHELHAYAAVSSFSVSQSLAADGSAARFRIELLWYTGSENPRRPAPSAGSSARNGPEGAPTG